MPALGVINLYVFVNMVKCGILLQFVSLITDGVGQTFMCLLAFCIYCVNYLFIFLPFFY